MAFRVTSRYVWLAALGFQVACQPSSTVSRRAPREDVQLQIDRTTIESIVPHTATLEGLLLKEQVPAELASSLVTAVRDVFNPRELRADRPYWISRTLDGLFREFRYQIDADRLLRVVFHDEPGRPAATFDVEVVTLPKTFELDAVAAEISRENNSLIGAFEAYGENQQLPLLVADIFSGEVDFNSELNLGDRVDVLFERAVRNGDFIGYGDVRAARLKVGRRELTAFRFSGPDGKPAWYDEQGRSLRRAFLKSPLPFNPRVTSGFSYSRFHPVHRSRRPHLGVDFGAPEGTAVYAVAAGVVQMAGWSGEAGRMVRIRHAGGFETAYLHLSGFAAGIRPGTRVQQGDLIGRVGMTGTATGPHLDYRVLKNGVYVNPMTAFRNMPAGEPIPADALPSFMRERDEALAEIESRLSPQPDATLAATFVEPR
jgi:murein DD-endopeptidase MepM/ murein hydrolase activator NlpD